MGIFSLGRRLSAVSLVLTLPACTFSRATMVNSEPQGAEVFYKTQLRGRTPAAMRMPCVGLQGGGDEPLAGFGDSVIELRKPGYRPLRGVVDGTWQWNNVVFGGVVGILLWGKCPSASHTYQLQQGSAALEGKATLTVGDLPDNMELRIGGLTVVSGVPLILPGDQTHAVSVSSGTVALDRGTVRLDSNTDYVGSLLLLPDSRTRHPRVTSVQP